MSPCLCGTEVTCSLNGSLLTRGSNCGTCSSLRGEDNTHRPLTPGPQQSLSQRITLLLYQLQSNTISCDTCTFYLKCQLFAKTDGQSPHGGLTSALSLERRASPRIKAFKAARLDVAVFSPAQPPSLYN